MIENQLLAFFVISFAATVITSGLAVYAWQQRPARGARTFSAMMATMALWNLAIAGGMIAPNEATVVTWITIRMVGVVVSPVLWLLFALRFAGKENFSNFFPAILLFILPVASIVLMSTNNLHHIFIREIEFKRFGPYILDTYWHPGTWFAVHVAYSYILVLIGDYYILREAAQLAHKFRGQAVALFIATFVPLLVNIAYTFHWLPNVIVNYDPIGFVIAGIAFAWGVFHFRLFELRPVARRFIFDRMQDGFLVVDTAGRIVDINPEAQTIFQVSAGGAIGMLISKLIPEFEGDRPLAVIENGRAEIRREISSGERHYQLRISPLYIRNRDLGHIILLHDTTAEKAMEAALRQLALRDPLTEVFNRRHFFELAKAELVRARRYQRDLAIIIFDCDHFKRVNDRFGHMAGDQVLKAVAHICQKNLRRSDVLARYGGEEFIILSPESSRASAGLVAERLRKAIEDAEIHTDNGKVQITVSVGVASLRHDFQTSIEEITHQADQALYQSKTRGRNRVTIS